MSKLFREALEAVVRDFVVLAYLAAPQFMLVARNMGQLLGPGQARYVRSSVVQIPVHRHRSRGVGEAT